jgi:uncharacterized protein (DUF2252 family)
MHAMTTGTEPKQSRTKGETLSAIAHLSVEERAERGRAARKHASRASPAQWDPPTERANPVALLQGQELTWVPALVPIRHERMIASPFAFYRGAAAVMAADVAAAASTGLRVQACGDAHLANFGGFAAPDRKLVFDINDFDETSHGPFEWDVKRLVASFEIASRAREFSTKARRGIVRQAAASYREAMAGFAAMTNLDVWYARLDADQMLAKFQDLVKTSDAARLQRVVAKAETRDNVKAFEKLTTTVDGEVRIANDPPLIVTARELAGDLTSEQLHEWVHERFRVYRHSLQPDRRHLLEGYRLVDVARKVVGVGSVGTRCWIVLLLGKDDTDPLFLQVKEAEASVLEPYGGRSSYGNHGQRVVEGQRLLQAASDVLLGWFHAHTFDGEERDFYVRQLWDWKVSANLDTMSPTIMSVYAQMCGWTLARAHARSGDRVAIASYLGSSDAFDRAVADFAVAYADQNERDYELAKATLSSS